MADPVRLARLAEASPDPSWMRYGADGGCLQAVDLRRGQVTKLALNPQPERIRREAALRRGMGMAVPPILCHDPEAGMVVEAWLDLRPVKEEDGGLARAIGILRERLYRPVPQPLQTYLAGLARHVDLPRVAAYLAGRGLNQVNLCLVHGDLWSDNLGEDPQGNLVLLDWEYARICIQSHDVWTFFMQRWSAQHQPCDAAFLDALREGLRQCLPGPWEPAAVAGLHLLHLIERYAWFTDLQLTHKDQERALLHREITRSLQA
jgi:hypothetical protein